MPEAAHNSSGGERRLVTALCYDLVGSTDLLVHSDVEDFDELIQDFQRRARHAVVSRGASLRETGDGGVALFPVGIDARDAASVAISAGLEIVEACARVGRERDRADVHVRVGVATSMGLVRDRPEKPSPDNVTAVALAMASRLQTIAEPDTVAVSQQTRMLAGRSHAFSFQGVRRIKGIAERRGARYAPTWANGSCRFHLGHQHAGQQNRHQKQHDDGFLHGYTSVELFLPKPVGGGAFVVFAHGSLPGAAIVGPDNPSTAPPGLWGFAQRRPACARVAVAE